MYVRSIVADNWEGVQNHEETIGLPCVADLERMFKRLDASRYTMIVLSGEGDAHMAIGGGAGRYVAYATFDNISFWNLIDSKASGPALLVCAGGQVGDYPARQVVSDDMALRAAKRYLESGQLDSGLRWEMG